MCILYSLIKGLKCKGLHFGHLEIIQPFYLALANTNITYGLVALKLTLKQSRGRNNIQKGFYSTQNIPEMTGKLGREGWSLGEQP